jgi:hypothetical protein
MLNGSGGYVLRNLGISIEVPDSRRSGTDWPPHWQINQYREPCCRGNCGTQM